MSLNMESAPQENAGLEIPELLRQWYGGADNPKVKVFEQLLNDNDIPVTAFDNVGLTMHDPEVQQREKAIFELVNEYSAILDENLVEHRFSEPEAQRKKRKEVSKKFGKAVEGLIDARQARK